MAKVSRFVERSVCENVYVAGAFDVSVRHDDKSPGVKLVFASKMPIRVGATEFTSSVTISVENPDCLKEVISILADILHKDYYANLPIACN